MSGKKAIEPPDLAAFSKEEMREMGYRVIDMIVDHRQTLLSKPVHQQRSRADLDQALPQQIPTSPGNVMDVLDLVENEILNGVAHTDHPRFFGYIPSPNNYVSILADTLTSGYNIFAGHWIAGSSAAAVEATTLKWLAQLMGFPSTTAGIFLSGGSMANLSAIHVARDALVGPTGGHDPQLVIYATSQAHSSITKATRILGFSASQLRAIPVTPALTMDCDALESAIEADKKLGLTPFLVVATAGTTNTGAIDPLRIIRNICDGHQLWMHVDGAYGAAARISPQVRSLLDGIEQADSLTLDPHKWWFQPFEIGCLLVRNGGALRQGFSIQAEYLRESYAAAHSEYSERDAPLEGELNFYEFGPELTRSFRALKLWMFFQVYGLEKIRRMIEKGINAATTAEQMIDSSQAFQIVTPASIGILTFCPRAKYQRSTAAIQTAVKTLLSNGYTLITTTEIDGQTVFRLCPIHPDLDPADLQKSLHTLAGFLPTTAA